MTETVSDRQVLHVGLRHIPIRLFTILTVIIIFIIMLVFIIIIPMELLLLRAFVTIDKSKEYARNKACQMAFP